MSTELTRERTKKVDKKARKLLRKFYNNSRVDKSSGILYRFILYMIFNQLFLATSKKK